MRIYLIRHGLTALGEQGKYQGALDAPLSDRGKTILKAAERCPERVYVTPLVRTAETASRIFPDSPQSIAEGLREMNFGAFEGRSWKEMENDPAYREWVDGNCDGQCPGGEDRMTFSDRVCRAFEDLVKAALRDGKEELAIVAHGGTQMAVLERWGGQGKAYYEWQTPCGKGWLLDTENWPESLRVIGELDYTKQDEEESGR